MWSTVDDLIGGKARNERDERRQKLLDRQRQREDAARAEGEQQFRAQVALAKQRGTFTTDVSVGRSVLDRVLTDALEPLEHAIAVWQQAQQTKRPTAGKPLQGSQLIRTWLAAIGPRLAAYLTLKFVLDGVTKQESYTQICQNIARSIQDELQGRRLREQAPKGFKIPSKRRKLAAATTRLSVDMTGLNLTDKNAEQLGGHLVDLLNDATQGRVVTLTTVEGKTRPEYVLEASTETDEWLTEQTDALAILEARNQPMVVPPLQWAPEQRGGYRYALAGKYPLVRRSWETKERIEWNARLEQAAMPTVYVALNAIQGTAWQINGDVLTLVRKIEQRGGGLAGIPTTKRERLPPRPTDTSEEAQKGWERQAARTKERNRANTAKMRMVQRTLETAERVLDADEIWFPHSLDFRGRVYPIADYLHPQGDDLSKALLMFAHGKSLDQQGTRWLAIHGANRLKKIDGQITSRRTFEERVAWVQTNTARIERVADDPFGDTWWAGGAEVDDPLQFFAFCVEWRNLSHAKERGETYISHLPVSIDGSCNGLQHYAALLQDADSGRLVNLVPQDRPQDMYQRAADVVCEKLEALAPKNPLAAKILDAKLVTRKLAKGPTMTFFYGSKGYGLTEQLKDYLKDLDNWDEVRALFTDPEPERPGKHKSHILAACGLLARTIEEAIRENAKKPVETMQWLQDCSNSLVTAKRSPEWIIPATGFGVRQVYPEWQRQQVKTMFAGKARHPRLRAAKDDTRDRRKHCDAISPNVIHSLDAAALMLTVAYAADHGVTSFATIHDGYAVLAADCALLAQAARQSFALLYSSPFDMLTTLYEQFIAQGADPTKCPLPTKGSLDVNAVLASDYFFA